MNAFWKVGSGVANQTSSKDVAGSFSKSFDTSLCRSGSFYFPFPVNLTVSVSFCCSGSISLPGISWAALVGLWLECSTLTSRLLITFLVRILHGAHKFGGGKGRDRWVKWMFKADVRYHGPSQGQRRGLL